MLDSIYLSWLGIVYLIMLFIPNFFWTKHQPLGYDAKSENLILLTLERIGQVLVTCFAIISFQKIIWQWDILLIIATIAMFFYEGYWIRYFHSDCTLQDFYSSSWSNFTSFSFFVFRNLWKTYLACCFYNYFRNRTYRNTLWTFSKDKCLISKMFLFFSWF